MLVVVEVQINDMQNIHLHLTVLNILKVCLVQGFFPLEGMSFVNKC